MEVATSFVTLGSFELMIWLHTARSPTREVWDEKINLLRAQKARRGGDMTTFRSLVVSDGAHPSARERNEIFGEIFGQGPYRFAAVSVDLDKAVLRGVATVIQWLMPGFRAYKPAEIAIALAHLELTDHADAIFAELARLQEQLPANRTLQLARAACVGEVESTRINSSS
jgi:hypothetical protein